MGAEELEPFIKPSIIGDNGAAFAGSDSFHWMKAERGHVRVGCIRFPMIGCSQRMCAVGNDHQFPFPGDRADCCHVTRMTTHMDRHDSFRPCGNQPFDLRFVNIVRISANIAKNRFCANGKQHVRRGNKRHRWDDHFISFFQSCREICEVQRCGTVAHGNDVAHATLTRKSSLKMAHRRTLGEKIGNQDIGDALNVIGINALSAVLRSVHLFIF